MKSVGERIKSVREKLHKSQVDFADDIGVSKQTLYKYENNIITNIPSDKIEAIAKLGNVSPAFLMGWDEEKHSSDNDPVSEDLVLLNRAAKKMEPEQIQKLLEIARIMFKEEFDD